MKPVSIIGAGSGELEMMTIKGYRRLLEADVILYDALLRPSIIEAFPSQAETLFVGKRCGKHAFTQSMISEVMLDRSQKGKHVVRLKGGDPSLFAHLAEEIAALKAANIPYEIVPGVSAASAAAAHFGVPLTERGKVSNVWITDGHNKNLSQLVPQMAKFSGTLVFYMAAGRIREILQSLIHHGIDTDISALIVESALSRDARQFAFTLKTFLEENIALPAFTGPTILLVGSALCNAIESLSDPIYAHTAQF